MADLRLKIVKDIPLGKDGSKVPSGTDLYLIEGVFYVDQGVLDKAFQEDFKTLYLEERENGWNYLRPNPFPR